MTSTKLTPSKTALLIFLVSLAYFLSYMRYGLAYDEGYLLDSVERILDGQVIYRDFHHTYAPGGFYLLAALFKIFGHNILIERAVFALLEALRCALAFLVVRTVTKSRFAYLAPVLIVIAPGPWHKVFIPSFGFFALYAVLAVMARLPRWYLAAGAAIGLAAVFRQDVAGFAAAGCLVALAVESLRQRQGIVLPLKKAGYLFAGIALAVAPVVVYFSREHALGAMVHKLTVDGMLDNMTNRIPFPGLGPRGGLDRLYLAGVLPVKALFYLPFAAYALSAAALLRAFVRRTWTQEHTAWLVILVTAALAFNQSAWRADLGHLLQTMQYVFLLVPILVASGHFFLVRKSGLAGRRASGLEYGILTLVPVALLWATIACLSAATDARAAARFQQEGVSIGDTEYLGSALVRVGNNTPLGLKRAPLYVTPGEARFFSEIKRFLDANTSEGEYVLAVPQLQTLYFLFDRRNPTRYAHYRRRLAPDEELRYIDDIRSHGTGYILLTEPFEGAKIGQTSESFGEYAGPVREWILENYDSIGRIGWVKVLRKKP